MPATPWTLAPYALAAALLVAGLSACGQRSMPEVAPVAPTTGPPTTLAPTSAPAPPTTLPPTTVPPTTSPTLDQEAQVIADFLSTVEAFNACTAAPDSCDIASISAPGTRAFEGYTKIISRLASNGLRGRPGDEDYVVVEAVAISPDGQSATLRTCIVDGGVTFDPRGTNDPSDDIILDDSFVSARTTWQLNKTASGWRRADNERPVETPWENQCPPPGS